MTTSDRTKTLSYLEDIIDRDMNELNEDEEARRAELQANSKETMDIPVVDLTEDNSLPYDDFLSQCITIPSSPCPSIKGVSDAVVYSDRSTHTLKFVCKDTYLTTFSNGHSSCCNRLISQ